MKEHRPSSTHEPSKRDRAPEQPLWTGGSMQADREFARNHINTTIKAWRKSKEEKAAAQPPRIPQGGGAPLGGEPRARMEQAFATDFSSVRIHTGGDSAQAAEQLGARAFTVGQDVHFGPGEYRPGTPGGDHLLGHELTHTVQARGAGDGVQAKLKGAPDDAHEAEAGVEVSQPGDALEQEADHSADHAVAQLHGASSGAAPQVAPSAAPPPIQAKMKPEAVAGFWKFGGKKQPSPTIGAAADKSQPPPAAGGAIKGQKAPTPAPNPDEATVKNAIQALKGICANPLQTPLPVIEALIHSVTDCYARNKGPLFEEGLSLAFQAQTAWDHQKCYVIQDSYNKALLQLDPHLPRTELLVPVFRSKLQQEVPNARLLLTLSRRAVQNALALVDRLEQQIRQEKAKQQAAQTAPAAGHDAAPVAGHAPAASGGHDPRPPAPHAPDAAPKTPALEPPKPDARPPAHAPIVATPKGAPPEQKPEAEPAGPPKPAAAPEPSPEELLAQFRSALHARDAGRAQAAWTRVPKPIRGQVSAQEVVEGYLLSASLGAEMHVATTAWSVVNYAALAHPRVTQVLAAMKQTSNWQSFLALGPVRQSMTRPQIAAMRGFMMQDQAVAGQLFEKAFPPAKNDAYPGGYALTIAWTHNALMRLYDALLTYGLPAQHIGAVNAFYLCDLNWQNGRYEPSSGGWYSPDSQVVGFGIHALESVDKGKKDSKKEHNANAGYMNFFEGAALHEVGHAVGERFGGDTWAQGRNGFKAENPETWSKALFTFGAGSKLKKFFRGKNALEPDDARRYMATVMSGAAPPPIPGFASSRDVEEQLDSIYCGERLYRYYRHVRSGHPGYAFSEVEKCVSGGRVYYHNVTFEPQLRSRLVSCNAETVSARVSIYSLASVKEWFAENYMAYYKTPNALGSKVASDVKSYLDQIHASPAAAQMASSGPGAAPTKSESGKPDGERAAQSNPTAERAKRISFPVSFG